MTVEELIEQLNLDGKRYAKHKDQYINIEYPYYPIEIEIDANIAFLTSVDSMTGVSVQYAINIPSTPNYDIFNQVVETLRYGADKIGGNIDLIFKENENEENSISE